MGSYKLLQITATDRLIPTTFASLKHEPRRHALNGDRERSDISGRRQFGYRNQQNRAVLSMNSEIGLFEQWDLLNWNGARGSVVVKALRCKPAGRGFDSRWCHWPP